MINKIGLGVLGAGILFLIDHFIAPWETMVLITLGIIGTVLGGGMVAKAIIGMAKEGDVSQTLVEYYWEHFGQSKESKGPKAASYQEMLEWFRAEAAKKAKEEEEEKATA